MSTGLIYDNCFLQHDTGSGHPERPDRLRAIVEALRSGGLWERVEHLAFEPADEDRLRRLHDGAYLDRLDSACAAGEPYIDVVDSAICSESAWIARRAAGGVLRAVEAVMSGEVGNAFCAVRPPGHHAEADRSMGFCLYANVALAAEALVSDHGLERVAVIDFDVHHGNGTQHLLESRADVLFISVHQSPQTCYPGTGFAEEIGTDGGAGFTLNIPLPPGSGDADYLRVFDEQVVPKLDDYRPEFVLISAGFDAAAADPLAQMQVSTEGFRQMTDRLLRVADRHAQGRVVSVLEGGYDLAALSAGVTVHLQQLVSGGGDIL